MIAGLHETFVNTYHSIRQNSVVQAIADKRKLMAFGAVVILATFSAIKLIQRFIKARQIQVKSVTDNPIENAAYRVQISTPAKVFPQRQRTPQSRTPLYSSPAQQSASRFKSASLDLDEEKEIEVVQVARPSISISQPDKRPELTVRGKIKGQVSYQSSNTFKSKTRHVLILDGTFDISKKKFLNGQGQMTIEHGTFKGEFAHGKLKTGSFRGEISGEFYNIDMVDSKFTKVIKFKSQARQQVEDAEEWGKQNFWEFSDYYLDFKFSIGPEPEFEGGIEEGTIHYGDKVVEVKNGRFKFDVERNLQGNGQLKINQVEYTGDFKQWQFFEGTVTFSIGKKTYAAQIQKGQMTLLEELREGESNLKIAKTDDMYEPLAKHVQELLAKKIVEE